MSNTDHLSESMKMSQERLLAIHICYVILDKKLSVDTTPAGVMWEEIEKVIVDHRKRFGDPVGRDISERY